MVVIICGKYGNNWSRTENVIERTQFSKSRSNNLEDIGQCQRSSHVTHLLMLVIICLKYGKNPSRTVDATERTRFSRPRPNDLEDIGQGQRSLYATHPLTLVIICAKYGKNLSRTEDFFFKVKAEIFFNKANLRDLIAATGLVILLKLDSNCRFFSRETPNLGKNWPWNLTDDLQKQ